MKSIILRVAHIRPDVVYVYHILDRDFVYFTKNKPVDWYYISRRYIYETIERYTIYE